MQVGLYCVLRNLRLLRWDASSKGERQRERERERESERERERQ
jgi:hypothetical protein